MEKKIRLGMLTPSSNTVVETMTTAMLSEVADVSDMVLFCFFFFFLLLR